MGISYELFFLVIQIFFLKMLFHNLQCLQVFLAGLHHAVVFVVAYTFYIMCAGGKENDVVVSVGRLRSAFAE